MKHRTYQFFLLLSASAAVAAQTAPRVLGLSDAQFHRFNNACGATSCPNPLPPTVSPWAGGVAHDPRDRNTWISNGTMMAKIDPRSSSCAVVCPPFPAPDVVPGEEITGLAFNEQTQRLFVSHSDNRILTYSAIGCALTLLANCTVTVPTNHIVSGLATDDVNGLIYWGSAPWLGAGVPPQVTSALQTSPCTPTCTPFNVPSCNGPVPLITGLGFDPCRRALHVTDGRALYILAITGCTPTFVGCCFVTVSGPQIGLCHLPSTEVSTGNVCFIGSVTPCPPMTHTLVGDPAIGNSGFGLALNNAPANTFAVLALNFGGCSPGSTFSFLCTDIPSSFPVWDFVPSTGGVGCGGAGFSPLPIPPVPGLCGVQVSTRWWGFDATFPNNYVSNCLTWAISGS